MSFTLRQSLVLTASDSDVAIGYQEALDESVAVLEGFVDPESLRPRFAVDPNGLIESYAAANSVPVGKALATYRETLKSLAIGQLTRFDQGRVSLDVEGHFDGRLWSCPPVGDDAIPQIVFCSLRTTSAMYKPGKCEAIAVYYTPPMRTITRISGTTGLPYNTSDDYDARGYLGVVQTFDSIERAQDAQVELSRAVQFFGRGVPSAYDDDPEDETPVVAAAPVEII